MCKIDISSDNNLFAIKEKRLGIGINNIKSKIYVNNKHAVIDINSANAEQGEDKLGKYTQREIVSCNKDIEFKYIVKDYGEKAGILVKVSVKNNSGDTVKIGKIYLLDAISNAIPCLELGEGFEDYKIYMDSGNMNYAYVRNLKYNLFERRMGCEYRGSGLWNEGDDEHRCLGTTVYYNPTTEKGFMVGFLSFDRARSEIITHYSDERVEHIEAWSDYVDYELKSKEELESEALWIQPLTNPVKALEEYGELVKLYNDVKLPEEIPTGWCSWYYYREKLTEQQVLKDAEAIKTRLKGYPVKWMQVDLGWFEDNKPGEYTKTNERFPSGIESLAKKLKQMGLELGLWYCPSVVLESTRVFKQHPGWGLSDKSGNPLPRHLNLWTWEPRESTYDLDPTEKGVASFVKKTYEDSIKMGCSYVKNDFLEQLARGFVEHKDKTVAKGYETYRLFLKLIKDALNGKSFILGCSNLTNASVGLVDSNRTAPDIGLCGGKYPWNHFVDKVRTIAARWYQHKNFWINDADPISVDERGSLDEARIRAAVVALSGGTVMLDAVHHLSEERLKLYKVCLPPYGDAARPLDLFTHTRCPQIWDLAVKTDWDNWHVVGLFNMDDDDAEIEVRLSEIGFSDEEVVVYEFWGGEVLGVFKDAINVKVKGRSCKVISVRKKKSQPQVVGTDMHITQGGVELNNVVWDEAGCTLSGIAQRPEGKATITMYCPERYETQKNPMIANIKKEIVTLAIDLNNGSAEWKIKFIKH